MRGQGFPALMLGVVFQDKLAELVCGKSPQAFGFNKFDEKG
jgi:hypothetical protein